MMIIVVSIDSRLVGLYRNPVAAKTMSKSGGPADAERAKFHKKTHLKLSKIRAYLTINGMEYEKIMCKH